MVNYGDEIERAGEEARRRLARLREDMADWNQRVAATSRALTEQSTHEMRQFWTEQERVLAQHRAEAEKDRKDAEGRQPQETEAVRLREEAQRPADEEARKQHEAISRSAAARRANDVVTPIDDDGDEEAEYYRRSSWLV